MDKIKLDPTIFREAYISFKLSGREKEKIARYCKLNSLTLSDFVRKAIQRIEPGLIDK